MFKEVLVTVLYITGLVVLITEAPDWQAQVVVELVGICIIIIAIIIAKGDKPNDPSL